MSDADPRDWAYHPEMGALWERQRNERIGLEKAHSDERLVLARRLSQEVESL